MTPHIDPLLVYIDKLGIQAMSNLLSSQLSRSLIPRVSMLNAVNKADASYMEGHDIYDAMTSLRFIGAIMQSNANGVGETFVMIASSWFIGSEWEGIKSIVSRKGIQDSLKNDMQGFDAFYEGLFKSKAVKPQGSALDLMISLNEQWGAAQFDKYSSDQLKSLQAVIASDPEFWLASGISDQFTNEIWQTIQQCLKDRNMEGIGNAIFEVWYDWVIEVTDQELSSAGLSFGSP